MSAANWYRVLLRPDVRVGRSDPTLAPVGYRTLAVYQLAEQYYHAPGLAARLEAQTPPALIRRNASELVALLQAGELDYIVDYESLARANHLRYVRLPPEIDLGDPARAAEYARASVRVARRTDTVTYTGAPIVYGIGVPRDAPHPAAGARFLAFLLGPRGARAPRRARGGRAATARVHRRLGPRRHSAARVGDDERPAGPRDASRRHDRRGRGRRSLLLAPPRASHRGGGAAQRR